MGFTIGVILLIIAVLSVIGIFNMIDSRSKRERGIPREKKRKGIHGKKEDD